MPVRIYIVEDEALIAMELEERLLHLGYGVCGHSTRGAQAVTEIPQLRPDIILMDINLGGGMTGIDVAERLRHQYDAPIIFLTAYSDSELIEKAAKTGSSGYLIKPFESRMLKANIDMAISKHAMEKRNQLSSSIFAQSREGIIITDQSVRIVFVNRAFTEITGYDENEVLGKDPHILSSGRHDGAFYRKMWEGIEKDGYWQGEILDRRKDGQLYVEWVSISRVLDDFGKVSNYIAIFSDITDRKNAEESVQKLAHYDPLTGLPNRNLLSDRVNQAVLSASRHPRPLALLFLDLDRFKSVNDNLGHLAGDDLLLQFAERLKEVVRDEDTVSRLAGDEFIILLPETGITGAANVAERLVSSITKPYRIGPHELEISASIGVAMYPSDGEDFQSLLQSADTAMYRAKQDGRNTYRFFTHEMQVRSVRILLLENALGHAFESGRLMLHYQPQVSLEDGRISGIEALLRWEHTEFGLLLPAEFIAIAENTRLILPIGEWALRESLRQMKQWIESGIAPMTISLNISALQFRNRDFASMIAHAVKDSGLPPAYVELELTETEMGREPALSLDILNDIRQTGVRLALDDFGAGNSSLDYLRRFPIDRVKIDRTFIRDLERDERVVKTIISLAKNMGFGTVAKGVETEEQFKKLSELGCQTIQGFFFSRPLPPEEMKTLFQAEF